LLALRATRRARWWNDPEFLSGSQESDGKKGDHMLHVQVADQKDHTTAEARGV